MEWTTTTYNHLPNTICIIFRHFRTWLHEPASVCWDEFQPRITEYMRWASQVDGWCKELQFFYPFHHPGITFFDQHFLWLDFFHKCFSLRLLNVFGYGSSFFRPKLVNSTKRIFSHHHLSHCFILLGFISIKYTLQYSILALNSPSTQRKSSTIQIIVHLNFMAAMFAWDWNHCTLYDHCISRCTLAGLMTRADPANVHYLEKSQPRKPGSRYQDTGI